MPFFFTALAALTLVIWLYLFFARGFFWRIASSDADDPPSPSDAPLPRVAAIVPARNEAATVAETISALIHQNYPGEFSILIVDDHSEDATASLAQSAADNATTRHRVFVTSSPELLPGWTGKLSALNSGVATLATNPPDFYWFTDADIVHAPDTLSRLVARAESQSLDLTSLMVLLQSKTFPERFLIPPFLYFFLMLYPPRWNENLRSSSAGAAGGCILLRRSALERIGGLSAIRSEVIDDCALARAVKSTGGKIWMGLTRSSVSLRVYGTFSEIRDMIARTAFTQLRYSPLILLGTLLGMFLTYIAPIALLFAHAPLAFLFVLAAWLLMTLSFLPTVRYFRLSPLWAPFLPLAALFYSYATWLSAFRYWLGSGGQWKGRSQASRFV